MKYNLNELEVFNVAVNTETSAELVMMAAWLKSQGKQCDLTPEDWDVCKENTCIVVTQNTKVPVIVSHKDIFERRGIDIVSASEQFDTAPKLRTRIGFGQTGLRSNKRKAGFGQT